VFVIGNNETELINVNAHQMVRKFHHGPFEDWPYYLTRSLQQKPKKNFAMESIFLTKFSIAPFTLEN
jgi:hypothetical protein